MDLLDIRRMEENRMELNKTTFKVQDLLENLEWMKDTALHEQKKMQFSAGSNIIINADLNILTRICENLLSNALKHTPKGGHIELIISQDDKRTLFEVKDTGEGIPEKYLDRIFDSFFKVTDQQLKTKLDTGLGLAFCKMAVEAHGGNIKVESHLGKGSRFFVTIPK